jgi:cobyrinic acid a,c-diamide synthase
MRHLPRIAVGSLEPSADRQPMVWGLLAALHGLGQEVVHFHSASCLTPHDAARSLTGSGSRHLDSWAMSRSACARTILRATDSADLSIVDGVFDTRHSLASLKCETTGGSLDTLCDWLEVPRVAVVDLATIDPCNLPRRPQALDGLLLDRALDVRHAAHWQTNLEALWNVPVLGWLDRAESLRSLCRTLPAGRDPSPALCAALGSRLLANLRIDRLLALADRSPLPALPADDLSFELESGSLRIAIAYDEEYCGYFPDTLDLLEEAGAELCDFSPLRSGALPDGADVVYFGCGHPERQPEVLAGNHCLHQSLRDYAAAGGRIYGEGSGLAYLCREIDLGDGRRVPMAGLLPAVAHRIEPTGPPEPVELTFAAPSWLVEEGDYLRGYRHPGWTVRSQGTMVSYAQSPDQRLDMIGRGNVIGSRLMVNLAANEHLLRRFVAPRVPAGALARRHF